MAVEKKNRNLMPEQDAAVRARNFKEVALGFSAELARDEASRCLNCKNAPCMKGCPVGVRIPDHVITQTIVEALGEPLACSTLIMPGETEPLTDGFDVDERIGHQVDLVVVGPVGVAEPTTVIDFAGGDAVVARVGAGDISLFD